MNEWISAEVRMPANQLVILFWSHNDSAIRIGSFYSASNRFVSDGDRYDRHDITHWQPLPEAPK
jgi:hypothetical protein